MAKTHRYNGIGWSKAAYRRYIKKYLEKFGSKIIGRIRWIRNEGDKREWSECEFFYKA